MLSNASDLLSGHDIPVWLITACHQDLRGGLIATFVQTASLVPELPRVVVGLAKHHHTTGLIEGAGRFGLHALTEDNLDLVWRFGMHSGRDVDKLAGCSFEGDDVPLLSQVHMAMICDVEDTVDIGDRLLFVAGVVASEAGPTSAPVLTRNRAIDLATDEQRRELKRQRLADLEVDRQGILAWRRGRS